MPQGPSMHRSNHDHRPISALGRLEPLEERVLLAAQVTMDPTDRIAYRNGPTISFDLDNYFDDDAIDGGS